MGYEITRFTHAIDEAFGCSICKNIVKDPMQSPSEHLFCKECIETWLAVHPRCPKERVPLKLEDLTPASESLRDVVDNFLIKCDFASKGCPTVVKLVNLKDHICACQYHPYAPVICNKGCNIEMPRHECETNGCFKHFVDLTGRQKEEIKNLNDQVENQINKNRKLTEEMDRLRQQHEQEMTRRNDEMANIENQMKWQSGDIQRRRDQISIQEHTITELNKEIHHLHSEIALIQNKNMSSKEEQISIFGNKSLKSINDWVNEVPEFRVTGGVEMSSEQPIVLDGDNGWGCAQYVHSLEQTKFSFKVEILSVGDWVAIGIHPISSLDCNLFFGDGAIFHEWNGNFISEGKSEIFENEAWKDGDIIEYRIIFPSDFVNDGRRVELHFMINGQVIRVTSVVMPIDGFFPTFVIGTGSKIKFLSD